MPRISLDFLSTSTAKLADTVSKTKAALQGAGFEIVGEYGPYSGAHVIAVSSPALKKASANSTHGGFGAVMRIGVTKVGDKIQVSYATPAYWAAGYQMKGKLQSVSQALIKALGKGTPYGREDGFSDEDLREYQYMPFMPEFTDPEVVGEFGSQEAAVAKVQANLKAGKGKAILVYRVDLPKATLFGIGVKSGKGGDPFVMRTIDKAKVRHTAHLPYELLIEGGEAYMLRGRFRIAISFPDLTMSDFMRISDVPDAIIDAMKAVTK